jgi:membrane fusion protein (multidrug efflux system)
MGVRPNSIMVPERAVAELQGKNFVWVINPDNKASQRPVKVERQIGENFLIAEGLKAGDRIVVEGLQKVRDGVSVKPMTAEEMKAAAQAAKAAEDAKEAEAKHTKE